LSLPTCPNFAADPSVSVVVVVVVVVVVDDEAAVALLLPVFVPERAPEFTIRPEAIFINKFILTQSPQTQKGEEGGKGSYVYLAWTTWVIWPSWVMWCVFLSSAK
jgi:hypothetical protein